MGIRSKQRREIFLGDVIAKQSQVKRSALAGFDDLAGEMDGADQSNTNQRKALDTKGRHKAWLMRASAKQRRTFARRTKPIYRAAARKFLSATDSQWKVTTELNGWDRFSYNEDKPEWKPAAWRT